MKTAFQRLPQEFIIKWYPVQFRAWKRSKEQESVTRVHEDADKEFEKLPDPVKMGLLTLVPLQLEMLLMLGEDGLTRLRNAALTDNRASVASTLSALAESYHDLWYLQRAQQLAILGNKPAVRPDDVPWSELGESYRTECLELIWQLCVALSELSMTDFGILCSAAE